MRPIPILLLIDCEPDSREVPLDRPRPWLGFERFFDCINDERTRLARATGWPARFNWFWRMDPQIEAAYGAADWPLQHYASQLAEMRRQGDGIGLHTHAWNWHSAAKRWVADHGNASWIEHCLRSSFAAFRRVMGRDCEIFRFGDGWFDTALIPLLEELGACIDLTVESGIGATAGLVPGEKSTGVIPDRRGAPHFPYRPARTDFRRPDSSGATRLWEIPVSTGVPVKRPKLRHPLRLLRWARSAGRRRRQLNIEIGLKRFPRVFARALAEANPSYAAICVRTDVGTSEERLDRVRRNLDAILRHPLAEHFRFVTPGEALALLGLDRIAANP